MYGTGKYAQVSYAEGAGALPTVPPQAGAIARTASPVPTPKGLAVQGFVGSPLATPKGRPL